MANPMSKKRGKKKAKQSGKKARAKGKPPTVFVVDAEAGSRNRILALARSTGIKAEGFSSAEQFLGACDAKRPGCLVLDLRLPGMSGADLLEELADRPVDIPAIVVSGKVDVHIAVRAMKSGALDYLDKPFDRVALLDCIRFAVKLDAQVRQEAADQEKVQRCWDSLSPREKEAMTLVFGGLGNKEIGKAMKISMKTVEVHRSNGMAKMKVLKLADFVRKIMTAGVRI